ncbi:hypothetical protein WISP_52541 [Willisornis vidua]|uniref:Uncharacterized protein n=1 Tax=Willisornis vidua TaxID=1566151 RepID=A0ABQ9DDW1_9PASS|nr:hypothetical protein BTVI_82664 [Pitangus sulphuratus]KAJ7419675.1 hypothetical protein WISP_52541 [Willisornis vidua]
MNEEQFVSIDLDDDNVCSVCKLGTEKETLSFCHVCFELNIEDVFEELTQQVQEKDSLASELNVRHIAIEQLLKNYSKLPCLQMGRAGMKSNVPI